MTPRKNIMLGTAGHVDHGKTSLVKLLTGCDTDTLAEEKKRGLTIDIGFARCQMADENILGVIDVPGHVDFIRNMVAGAHGIDVVIFVVAADDGVMPQTREHLDILTLMGTRGGIIAMTKIDLVVPEMRELAAEDIRGLLAGTFLEDAPICPISNTTGEGYQELFDALNAAVAACGNRPVSGAFRMWCEDVYSIKGFGTVATGIPLSGQVAVGEHVALLPSGKVGRVRKLEVYGQESQAGRAGECVAINLGDVAPEDLGRGVVLCEGAGFTAHTMAEAELRLLPRAARPLKDYAEVQLNIGTAEVSAHVAMLEEKVLAPGTAAMVQLRLARPLGVAAGDRFVIRADLGGQTAGHLATIGGGRILSTSDIKLRRNRPWTILALQDRGAAIDDQAAWAAVCLAQLRRAVTVAELAADAQQRPAELLALLPKLVASGQALEAGGGSYASVAAVTEVEGRIVAALEKFHAENPQRLGLEQAELAPAVEADRTLMDLAAARLASAGKVQRQGAVLMLAGRGVKLSETERKAYDAIEQAMRQGHLAPPSPQELQASLGLADKPLARMLRLLTDQGVLVKLAESQYMHAEAVAAGRRVVLDLFGRQSSFETVEFRDGLGVSRKYAVPLLDYFDTVRLTTRNGNRRTPGAEAKKAMGV